MFAVFGMVDRLRRKSGEIVNNVQRQVNGVEVEMMLLIMEVVVSVVAVYLTINLV